MYFWDGMEWVESPERQHVEQLWRMPRDLLAKALAEAISDVGLEILHVGGDWWIGCPFDHLLLQGVFRSATTRDPLCRLRSLHVDHAPSVSNSFFTELLRLGVGRLRELTLKGL